MNIQFQMSSVNSDIKSFIADQLQRGKFKYLKEDLQKEVEQKLTEGARGM